MSTKNDLKSDIQMLHESPEVLMARGRELRSQMICDMLIKVVSRIKSLSIKCFHLEILQQGAAKR